MVPKAIITALTAATYAPIKLRRDNNLQQRSAAFYTSDASAWYMSWSASGDGEVPILAGSPVGYDVADMEPDGTLFYARSSTGTPNLICLPGGVR